MKATTQNYSQNQNQLAFSFKILRAVTPTPPPKSLNSLTLSLPSSSFSNASRNSISASVDSILNLNTLRMEFSPGNSYAAEGEEGDVGGDPSESEGGRRE